MSESYVPVPPSGFEPSANDDQSGAQTGKVDAAKSAAGDLTGTAAEQAGHVAGTAKEEAGNVAREAKSQAKDLYQQTQSELKEQASTQQQRVASGLRSLGEELGSMAQSSDTPGLAADLVRQVSERADSAASWLDARDPGSLLSEVKSYARRKPGTFIAAAAIAGVVAGRLTRALASAAADEKNDSSASGATASATATTSPAPVGDAAPTSTIPPVVGTPAVPPAPTTIGGTGVVDDTPLYTERAATFGDEGLGDGR